jgi:hypothetical protein
VWPGSACLHYTRIRRAQQVHTSTDIESIVPPRILSKNIGLDEFDRPGPASTWTMGPRGLSARVIMAWAGVRPYPDPANPGKSLRVFRDPAQLQAPRFVATLERIPAAIGHPVTPEGKYLYPCIGATDPAGEPAPFASDAVLVPFSKIQVGSVGDKIDFVDGGEGFLVPEGRLTITEPMAAIGTAGLDGQARKDETSLAFVKHDIRQSGVWTSPLGVAMPYDVMQVIDPGDPRVPPDLEEWLGAHYIGICFDRGKSRGGMTRVALDGQNTIATRTGSAPRTFFMYRQQDESGTSGTGHVLDGVIWPEGRMSFCWNSDAPSVGSFDSYADFASKHIDAHPTNDTIITFDDGGMPPAADAPSESEPEPAPTVSQDSTIMTPEQIKALQDQIDAMKKQIADLEAQVKSATASKEASTAEADKQKAAADAAAKTVEEQKAAAEKAATDSAAKVDSLEAQLAPYLSADLKKQRTIIARIAGLDSADLADVKLGDLKSAAMKLHFERGLSPKPRDESRLKDPVYLAGRYDGLEDTSAGVDSDDTDSDDDDIEVKPSERRADASPQFRQAHAPQSKRVAGADAKASPKHDAINDLP